jgi:hypothetical protein
LFESSEAEEKTQLLKSVLQNFSLQGKILSFEAKIPFSGILDYAQTGSMLAWWDGFRTFPWEKVAIDPKTVLAF